MCEICNNRYPNCPACCVDDSEPEPEQTNQNWIKPVAIPELIEAMRKLYINRDENKSKINGN